MRAVIFDRIRAHWHGNMSLWLVYFYCPFLILIPFGIAVVVGIVGTVLFSGWSRGAGQLLLLFAYVATDILLLWWCLGTIQKSLRLLSSQSLFLAAPVFASGYLGVFMFITEVAPQSLSDTAELVGEVQTERQLGRNHEREPWEKIPWTVTAQPELHRLIAKGDIGNGSAKALEKAIFENPDITLLEIDSPGGFVREEEMVFNIVQEHKLDTLVLGRCSSACTGIFLAGERRYIGPKARLGFHQAGFRGRAHDTIWGTPEYSTSISYREKNVSEEFMQQALNTSYFSLWVPDPLDVKLSGFATNWWSDRPRRYQ